LASYPALKIVGADGDRVLAIVDDYSPTAVDEDEQDAALRVFFSTSSARDAAQAALAGSGITAERIDVDDEDWARRSQADLPPITVGRLTVVSHRSSVASQQPPAPSPQPLIVIVIPPSMGFGTGHHATTRLCLAALQTIDLAGASVLDVGTGSGVLAIAASRLGAASAMGVDNDADAIQAARESLAANPEARHVTLEVADLAAGSLPKADVVTANLTGALLVRAAGRLAGAVRPGGSLIVSGLLAAERDAVRTAFAAMELAWEVEEDGWIGEKFVTGNPPPPRSV
jgi:ribosomal protein L11 methyltransferase